MLKFNPHRDVRIDRVKAHVSYLKPKKDPVMHRQLEHKTPMSEIPWEIRHITNFNAGKAKKKLDMDTVFDVVRNFTLLMVNLNLYNIIYYRYYNV